MLMFGYFYVKFRLRLESGFGKILNIFQLTIIQYLEIFHVMPCFITIILTANRSDYFFA